MSSCEHCTWPDSHHKHIILCRDSSCGWEAEQFGAFDPDSELCPRCGGETGEIIVCPDAAEA